MNPNGALWTLNEFVIGMILLLNFAIIIYIIVGGFLFISFVNFLISNYIPTKKILIYLIITAGIIILSYFKGFSDCDGNKSSIQLYLDRVFRLSNFFYILPLKIIFAFLCIYFLFFYLYWCLSFWFKITMPKNYYPIIMILVILSCLNSMYFFQIFIGFIIYYYIKRALSRNLKKPKNYINDYSKYDDDNRTDYKDNVLNVYYGDKNDTFNGFIQPDSEGNPKMGEDEALKRIIRSAAKDGSEYREIIKIENVKTLLEKQRESDIIGLTYDPAFRGYVIDSFMLMDSYMYFINHKKNIINLEKLSNLYTVIPSDGIVEFDFRKILIQHLNDMIEKRNQIRMDKYSQVTDGTVTNQDEYDPDDDLKYQEKINEDSSLVFVQKRLIQLILKNKDPSTFDAKEKFHKLIQNNGEESDNIYEKLFKDFMKEAREHTMNTYKVDEASVIKIEKVALSINAKPYGLNEKQVDLINKLLDNKDTNIKDIINSPTLFKLLQSFNDIGLLDYFDNFIELSKYKKNNGYKNTSKMILLIVVLIISTMFLFYFDNGLYFIHNIMNPDNIINYSDKNMYGFGVFIFFILICLYLFEILKTYIDKPDKTKKLSIDIRDYNSFPGFPYSFIKGWGNKKDGGWEKFLTMIFKLYIFIFCSPPFIAIFIAFMYYVLNINTYILLP